MLSTIRICTLIGDLGGCHVYRNLIPNRELKKYDVEVTYYPFLANMPGRDQFQTLVEMLSGFDLCIIQRSYLATVIERVKQATSFLGIPLIYEVDDDYENLIQSNPAYLGMVSKEYLEEITNLHPQGSREWWALAEHKRKEGLETYKRLMELPDLITVTTPELKNILYRHNKNIEVLPNNVEGVWEFRDHSPENAFYTEDSQFLIRDDNYGVYIDGTMHFGLASIPDHFIKDEGSRGSMAYQVPRIGYTGTPSHRGEDFLTIEYYWEKLIQKYNNQCWWVYIGDKYFWQRHEELRKSKKLQFRNLFIQQQPYDLYMMNYRNLDIAIAPLMPNVFNMSKSEIKAIEAASWKIPMVLPDLCTYNRTFKHGETALLYKSGKEFHEYTEELMHNPKLRAEIGQNGFDMVKNTRRECLWAEKRYNIYKNLIQSKRRLTIYEPTKTKESNFVKQN